jgi:hypothetical protein
MRKGLPVSTMARKLFPLTVKVAQKTESYSISGMMVRFCLLSRARRSRKLGRPSAAEATVAAVAAVARAAPRAVFCASACVNGDTGTGPSPSVPPINRGDAYIRRGAGMGADLKLSSCCIVASSMRG